MEPLLNYFKDIETHNILDVGTGSGGFVHALQQIFPSAQITGIDPDYESLEKARKKYPGVIFREMEAQKLLFSDDAFDVVSVSMALHHLPKIKKSLKEIKRVVKPGGFIIINETISNHLNAAQEMHKMYHHFRSRIDRLRGRFHRKTFTKEAILEMLKAAEMPVQFFYEYRNSISPAMREADLELRVEKMEKMLEQIKDMPEYDSLLPKIDEFRGKAKRYGFQPATNLVIVVRGKIIP
jgi:ubiquinone/menaquinone biosynthesis C-methylase UbiE